MSLKPLPHGVAPMKPRAQIESEIARFLELLFAPGDVFEIRAPECRDHAGSRFEYVVSGYYADAELAASAVADLDTRGSPIAIYVTLNPVDTALLARAANRLKARPKATTGDRDVPRRRWMLVDLDPVRPSGVSATEAEFRAAHDKALAIMDILIGEGWPAPLLGLSGNGAHLLFRIDLPADDNGLLRRVLAGLAQRFDDDAVKVDRSVHNPSRITKVMGTMSRKGDEVRGVAGVEDRVHRRAELLRVPNEIRPVSPELLERAALPRPPATTGWHSASGQVGRSPEEVRRWLIGHGVAVKGERRLEGCTMLLLERCPVIPEIESTGSSDIAVLVCDSGKLAYCNKHSRGEHLQWKDVRKALDPDWPPDPRPQDLPTSRRAQCAPEYDPADAPLPAEPGPLPDSLLRVPGFVGEVMDLSLATAPYPNIVAAFAGALALQAFLAGRKVRDPGDNRTNLYILCLAHSASGKEWPRKINITVLSAVNRSRVLGERLASGEGIQDALFVDPAMLVQTDEIDGLLQTINKSRDARYESLMSTLLTIYSAANSSYPMRRLANQEYRGAIEQPCLVLLGTAIPNHYYQALSERMLTNGFFARMLVLESGRRGAAQEPRVPELSDRLLSTARWWADFQPGADQVLATGPTPRTVEMSTAARQLLAECRAEADSEYAKAEAAQDPVATTVWGRVGEQIRKLALIYAVSEDHLSPSIGVEAVRWASELVGHITRRMLFMAAGHVAETPFQADCLRLLKKVREAPDRRLPHHVLLKRMKLDAKCFAILVETLVERGDLLVRATTTGGRGGTVYHWTGAES